MLMISNVKFRTFKRSKPSPVLSLFILFVLGTLIYVGIQFDPSVAIVGLMGIYVSSGIIEYVVRLIVRDKSKPDEVLEEGVELEFADEIERQYAALYDEVEEELID